MPRVLCRWRNANGMFIAFATAVGATALDRGEYAAAMVKELVKPGCGYRLQKAEKRRGTNSSRKQCRKAGRPPRSLMSD